MRKAIFLGTQENSLARKPLSFARKAFCFALEASGSARRHPSLVHESFCSARGTQMLARKVRRVAGEVRSSARKARQVQVPSVLPCAQVREACSPGFLGGAWGCPSNGGQRTTQWCQSATRHRLSSRLSCGSLLTSQPRQSATRPCLASCPSFGGQRQVLCRGKPQHKQPTVAASPPPLGGSGGLRYSEPAAKRLTNKHSGGTVAQCESGQGNSANLSICHQPNRAFKWTPTALASLRKRQARRHLTLR